MWSNLSGLQKVGVGGLAFGVDLGARNGLNYVVTGHEEGLGTSVIHAAAGMALVGGILATRGKVSDFLTRSAVDGGEELSPTAQLAQRFANDPAVMSKVGQTGTMQDLLDMADAKNLPIDQSFRDAVAADPEKVIFQNGKLNASGKALDFLSRSDSRAAMQDLSSTGRSLNPLKLPGQALSSLTTSDNNVIEKLFQMKVGPSGDLTAQQAFDAISSTGRIPGPALSDAVSADPNALLVQGNKINDLGQSVLSDMSRSDAKGVLSDLAGKQPASLNPFKVVGKAWDAVSTSPKDVLLNLAKSNTGAIDGASNVGNLTAGDFQNIFTMNKLAVPDGLAALDKSTQLVADGQLTEAGQQLDAGLTKSQAMNLLRDNLNHAGFLGTAKNIVTSSWRPLDLSTASAGQMAAKGFVSGASTGVVGMFGYNSVSSLNGPVNPITGKPMSYLDSFIQSNYSSPMQNTLVSGLIFGVVPGFRDGALIKAAVPEDAGLGSKIFGGVKTAFDPVRSGAWGAVLD